MSLYDDHPSISSLDYLVHEVYRAYIEEHVNIIQVAELMSCMQQILPDLRKVDTPAQAAQIFLGHLRMSKEADKYKELAEALLQTEYEVLYCALDCGPVCFGQDEHKKMMSMFSQGIEVTFSPSEVAEQLACRGVLAVENFQAVKSLEDNGNHADAFFLLVDSLARQNEKWYPHLLDMLDCCEYSKLVLELEPTYYELKGKAPDINILSGAAVVVEGRPSSAVGGGIERIPSVIPPPSPLERRMVSISFPEAEVVNESGATVAEIDNRGVAGRRNTAYPNQSYPEETEDPIFDQQFVVESRKASMYPQDGQQVIAESRRQSMHQQDVESRRQSMHQQDVESRRQSMHQQDAESRRQSMHQQDAESRRQSMHQQDAESRRQSMHQQDAESRRQSMHQQEVESRRQSMHQPDTENLRMSMYPQETEIRNPSMYQLDAESRKVSMYQHDVDNRKPSMYPQDVDNRKPSMYPQETDNRKPSMYPQDVDNRKPSMYPQETDNRKPSMYPQDVDNRKPSMYPQDVDNRKASMYPQDADNRKPSMYPQETESRRQSMHTQDVESRRPSTYQLDTDMRNPSLYQQDVESRRQSMHPQDAESRRATMVAGQTSDNRAGPVYPGQSTDNLYTLPRSRQGSVYPTQALESRKPSMYQGQNSDELSQFADQNTEQNIEMFNSVEGGGQYSRTGSIAPDRRSVLGSRSIDSISASMKPESNAYNSQSKVIMSPSEGPSDPSSNKMMLEQRPSVARSQVQAGRQSLVRAASYSPPIRPSSAGASVHPDALRASIVAPVAHGRGQNLTQVAVACVQNRPQTMDNGCSRGCQGKFCVGNLPCSLCKVRKMEAVQAGGGRPSNYGHNAHTMSPVDPRIDQSRSHAEQARSYNDGHYRPNDHTMSDRRTTGCPVIVDGQLGCVRQQLTELTNLMLKQMSLLGNVNGKVDRVEVHVRRLLEHSNHH